MREPVTSTASIETVPSFLSAGLAAWGLGTVTGVWAKATTLPIESTSAIAREVETREFFMSKKSEEMGYTSETGPRDNRGARLTLIE